MLDLRNYRLRLKTFMENFFEDFVENLVVIFLMKKIIITINIQMKIQYSCVFQAYIVTTETRVPNRPVKTSHYIAIMHGLTSLCGLHYRPAKCLCVINTTALTFPASTSIVR